MWGVGRGERVLGKKVFLFLFLDGSSLRSSLPTSSPVSWREEARLFVPSFLPFSLCLFSWCRPVVEGVKEICTSSVSTFVHKISANGLAGERAGLNSFASMERVPWKEFSCMHRFGRQRVGGKTRRFDNKQSCAVWFNAFSFSPPPFHRSLPLSPLLSLSLSLHVCVCVCVCVCVHACAYDLLGSIVRTVLNEMRGGESGGASRSFTHQWPVCQPDRRQAERTVGSLSACSPFKMLGDESFPFLTWCLPFRPHLLPSCASPYSFLSCLVWWKKGPQQEGRVMMRVKEWKVAARASK
mmetsp:Transcript_35384/g.69842  ORF Transcript_35384/g.69842 Transcript_35384/m.69842 type:complete len:296 (+) Transcript_35384:128-1015(+)